MRRWYSDFVQFWPSIKDGMRDYPLQMLFVAIGIAICLASPDRHEENANDWLSKLGSWVIRNTPLPNAVDS